MLFAMEKDQGHAEHQEKSTPILQHHNATDVNAFRTQITDYWYFNKTRTQRNIFGGTPSSNFQVLPSPEANIYVYDVSLGMLAAVCFSGLLLSDRGS